MAEVTHVGPPAWQKGLANDMMTVTPRSSVRAEGARGAAKTLGGVFTMTAAILRPVCTSVVTFLAVALAVLGLQVAAGARAHATPPATTLATVAAASPSMSRASYEAKVLHWINVRRAQHGLRALHLSGCTNKVANRWGRHLAATDTFYHQSMSKIMRECKAHYAAETLAMGGVTPKRIVSLWMHSPEHHAILMSRHPRRIGVGAYPNTQGAWVVAADFMRY